MYRQVWRVWCEFQEEASYWWSLGSFWTGISRRPYWANRKCKQPFIIEFLLSKKWLLYNLNKIEDKNSFPTSLPFKSSSWVHKKWVPPPVGSEPHRCFANQTAHQNHLRSFSKLDSRFWDTTPDLPSYSAHCFLGTMKLYAPPAMIPTGSRL